MNCLKNKVSKAKSKVAGLTIGLITIGFFIGNTPEEIESNIRSLQMVERVIGSSCFADEWMNSKVDENQLNGMDKAEALYLIQTTPIYVNLERYYKRNKTLAYTYKSSDTIWLNAYFHDNFSECEKGANLAHEIHGHKNGLTHDVKSTYRRSISGPYMIGTIFKKCCEVVQ